MYKKFLSVSQPSGVPFVKSGDTGGLERCAAALGVPGMGRTAKGPDAYLYSAVTVNVVPI
jgi:hypothetical protein